VQFTPWTVLNLEIIVPATKRSMRRNALKNRAFGSKTAMNLSGEEFLKNLLREKGLLLFSAPVLYERQRRLLKMSDRKKTVDSLAIRK